MKKRIVVPWLSLLFFVGILCIVVYGFSNTEQGLSEEDRQRAKDAIQKAALECYSIEGAYPESLDYLEEHYGLVIQEDMYRVRYHYIGANIMPDMDVYPRSERP